jgi:LAO/AO transport system kinase
VRAPIDLDECVEGVLIGDRSQMARAITLVESSRSDHADLAQELLVRLLPQTGRSHRVGMTGVPGAGKSTLIDKLGTFLTSLNHRVAVLAIDPSSTRRGGSILGDKTRMHALAADPNAFIRPSPSSGSLGGVTRSTREALLIVEAGGYDVVIVETVGVGQSEATVASMVDTFVMLMVPGTGDSLQGIKRGVLELADILLVNKADGDRTREAAHVARELADALHMFGASSPSWSPPVLTCSAKDGTGIDRLWQEIEQHHTALTKSGEFAEKRERQTKQWMWAMVEDRLLSRLRTDAGVRALAPEIERQVGDRTITATQGALLIPSLSDDFGSRDLASSDPTKNWPAARKGKRSRGADSVGSRTTALSSRNSVPGWRSGGGRSRNRASSWPSGRVP